MVPSVASTAAEIIAESFGALRERFDELTARAAQHFAARDWHGAHRDATARLLVYSQQTDLALSALRDALGNACRDCTVWSAAHAEYAARIAHRTDHEIAATFFNSVSRRMLGTVGVDRAIEFIAGAVDGECRAKLPLARVMLPDAPGALERVLRGIPLTVSWRDVAGDAALVHSQLPVAGRLEIITTPFYRNKGAYLVGRVIDADAVTPVVIALLHREQGVFVDAVITTSDEASIVFGFSWSYFQVAAEDPGAVVAFLASIMPLKRIDELYTAIGFHKHGKTELYRGLTNYLKSHDVRFEQAIGQPGMVMTVFALPSYNLVVKIIRDAIGYPKRVTRREVMAQYRFVFLRDRVGRLADAQEFERLELPRSAFPDDLLTLLMHDAPSSVRVAGNSVIIGHCYAQRRLIPLDVYLRSAPTDDARAAVRDYGQAIADLAHAGIFPGDMLLKNFGLSRHGRVIFYDYDEIEDLDDVVFRDLPEGSYEDEISAEPWFSVGEHDTFPEEFIAFLLPGGTLRDEFLATHRELLTADWWRDVQRRIRAGELFDVFPYRGITGKTT